jgi:hypothetical protein
MAAGTADAAFNVASLGGKGAVTGTAKELLKASATKLAKEEGAKEVGKVATTVAKETANASKKVSEMTAAERRSHFLEKGVPENEIGPSGYPKIHTPEHSSLKEAKDAARAEFGKGGTVEKHPSPTEGNGHFHGVSQEGEKSRIHHEYPQ